MKPLAKKGALAGLAGGAALLFVVCAHSASAGLAATLPIAWIGALIYGDDAMQGGGQGVTGGLVVHAAISAALGALFAVAIRKLPLPSTLPARAGAGLVFGLIAWALMVFLLVPAANPFLSERIAAAFPAWLAGHLAFGAVTGTVLALLLRNDPA